MRLLIVDDDWLHTEFLRREVNRTFSSSTVDQIHTELEFRDRFEEIASNPPDVIILDLMILWADPLPKLSALPTDVQIGGFYQAGLRCQALLAADERTSKLPVILHSVMDGDEIDMIQMPPNVQIVPKAMDMSRLVARIRSLIIAAGISRVKGSGSFPRRRVFLSHSHCDKRFVRNLGQALRQRGIGVWIDEAEIKIGESLIQKLRAGIDEVDFVVAVLSQAALASEWVSKELDIAMTQEIESRRIKVIPLLREDCDPPGFLKGKLFADFRKRHKRGSAINGLCDAILEL